MNPDTFALNFQAPDYLERCAGTSKVERDTILDLRAKCNERIWSPRLEKYREATRSMQAIQTDTHDCTGPVIKIGEPNALSEIQQHQVEQALKDFCPWKKGPYELFGHSIDSEWRSDWKWDRLLPHFSPLQGKYVADIGCHNGYFMFRMAEQDPACIVGFEPFGRNYWNFQLLQQWIRNETISFELLGVEHVHHFRGFFDTIFCLGILYHHSDPVGILRKLHQSLAKKGEMIIDCQGIPGDEPVSLTPRRRYAQARGIWFLPTLSCLENWMLRAGFANVECFFAEPLSTTEQRRTPWADIESLSDFLDPNDPTRTIEGYPAPWRYYVRATKT